MDHLAYLGIGSNIEKREHHLKNSLHALHYHDKIKIIDYSSIYETDPVGFENQGLFLNMVIQIRTSLSAEQLLTTCLQIENRLGRERVQRWGPRNIDIDILLFDKLIIDTDVLTVPHPRMCERGFVVVPLLEIDKNIQLPTMNKPLGLYFDKQNDNKGVRIWKRKNGEDVFALFAN